MGNDPSINTLADTAPIPKFNKVPKKSITPIPIPETTQNPQTNQHLVSQPIPPNPKEVFVCQKVVDFQQDFLARFRLTHPNLLRTLGFDLNVNYFANASFPMGENIYFEYAPKSINMLLKERKPNKLLSDGDMRAFFKDMIHVLSFLQENDISHGDLDTSTVFFDETQESFKIYDQEMLAGTNSGFCLTKQQVKSSVLAPELFYAFGYQPNLLYLEGKYFKADVFSLGMVFLEVGCLHDSVELYDFQNIGINKQLINERLSFMSQFYSREVVGLISMMLDFDEKKRPDFLQLRNILKQENFYNESNVVQYVYPGEGIYEGQQFSPEETQQNYYSNQQVTLPEPAYQHASHINIKKNSNQSHHQGGYQVQNEEALCQPQQVYYKAEKSQTQHGNPNNYQQNNPNQENVNVKYQDQAYYSNNQENPPKREMIYVPVYKGSQNQQPAPSVTQPVTINNPQQINQGNPHQMNVPQQNNPQQIPYNQQQQIPYNQQQQVPYNQQQQVPYNQQQLLSNQQQQVPYNSQQIPKNPQQIPKNPQQIPKNPQQIPPVAQQLPYNERMIPNPQQIPKVPQQLSIDSQKLPNNPYNAQQGIVQDNNYTTNIPSKKIEYQNTVKNCESNEISTYGELKRVDSNLNKNMIVTQVQAQIVPNQNNPNDYRSNVSENNVYYNTEQIKPQNNVPYLPQIKYLENYNTQITASFQTVQINPENQRFPNIQKENKNNEVKPEEKETKESLERLRMEILNSKKIIENYEKTKKNVENSQRKPFNEMISFGNNNNNIEKPNIFKVEQMESKYTNNSMNNLKLAHKTIIERNKKLDERLEEVLKKSQAITKALK